MFFACLRKCALIDYKQEEHFTLYSVLCYLYSLLCLFPLLFHFTTDFSG